MYKSAVSNRARIIFRKNRTPESARYCSTMKGFLCLIFVIVSMFCLASAAPQKSSSQHPSVQVIRYKNDADADAIIKNIIAQYEKLGGTSQLYNIPSSQTVSVNQK